MRVELVGTVLEGQYAVEREIGSGAMATVYLARDTRHDRPVAVKVVRSDLLGGQGAERFHREVDIAARLSHPHILPLYTSGEHEGSLYYVMPYVDGETLRDRLQGEGQLPIAEAVRLAVEVADGLAHAHAAGIIHRDIKPENILLEGGHAVLGDFGIARGLTPDSTLDLTGTGVSVGTPLYMSPEQGLGEPIDARSDIYSLGCVLYEMVTGEVPLAGRTALGTLARRRTEAPRPMRTFRARASEFLERTVRRALEANPADRFQSAEELRDALVAVERESAGLEVGPRTPESRFVRWPALLAAGGVGLVLIALVALWALGPWRGASGFPDAPIRSVAVLPFEDQSDHAAEQPYQASGLTQDLRDALSRSRGLVLASRESSLMAAADASSPNSVGASLDVDGVIQGNVLRAGESLRISVRLTDARSDRQVWGRTFAGRLEEIFALEREIADSLMLVLGIPAPQDEVQEKARTTDIATHNLFLQARFAAGDRTREGLDQAVDLFRHAIARDSGYAPAWAWLASALALTGVYEYRPWSELRAEAEFAADIAIRLDGTLAEAHTARGILLDYRFEWTESESAYLKALEYNPSHADAYHWYAVQRVLSGRPSEAPALIELARRLNPLSISINAAAGWVYYYLRDLSTAINRLEQARSMEPNAWIALLYLGLAYGDAGRVDEGIDALRRARDLNPKSRMLLPALARLHAQARDTGQARRLLAESARLGAPPPWMAIGHLSLGESEPALAWLERGYREAPSTLIEVNTFWFDPLRDHPRFRAIVTALHSGEWVEATP